MAIQGCSSSGVGDKPISGSKLLPVSETTQPHSSLETDKAALPTFPKVPSGGTPGGLAVSLGVLQQRLNAPSTPTDRDHLMLLCGLRRIDSVILDKKNDDIVLVGTTTGRGSLHLEDLVVGLRCAYELYGETKGSTTYITRPAVSIDPNPKVIEALDRLLAENKPGQPGLLQAYQKIGQSPQAVRVLGLPECRAASVAIDCDYNLKRLTNGQEKLPIDGWDSLFDQRAKPDREHPFDQKHQASQSFDRFWFKVNEVRFVESPGAVVLHSAPIKLMTEAQYMKGGKVQGSGRPDELAEAWATRFTEGFENVADHDSRYADLSSLYRTLAFAGLLRYRDDEFESKRRLIYLLNSFNVPEVHTPRQLPGVTRVEEANPQRTIGNRIESAYWCHTSCGGVDEWVPIGPENLAEDTTHRVKELADRVCAARPSPSALTWPIVLGWL